MTYSTIMRSNRATVTKVDSSATNVTLLAANHARLGASFYNNSTAILYLKCGATASTTGFTVQMATETYYELPYGYTGLVSGIWASVDGNCMITEFT